jgi:predicted small lipoprotein YifL
MHGTSRRLGGVWRVGLSLALLSAVAACGKKGNPLPPMRVIPNGTTDLAVAQRGNQLVLRFAYPQTTTAGAKLPGLSAVEVAAMTRQVPGTGDLPIVDAREFTAAGRPVATLSGAELQSAIEGGQVVVRLPLPVVPPPTAPPTPAPSPSPAAPGTTPTPAATPPAAPRTLYVYAVRTTAEGGETSAWSNLARLVPLPAPPPPTNLAVEPRAGGIALSWRDEAPGVAGFAVYRRPAVSRTYGEPLAMPAATAREYLDTTARYGERYIYTVTALGATEPRVESGFGEESEIGYEDRFAPAPPQDLVALPQQGAVSVVWQASADGDAVGYLVYRQDPRADWRKLTAEPIADLKFADSGLTPELLFRYRVTAVDAAGNEGPPTPVVEARPR